MDANVELYVPRKCSATNRVIVPTDHACVQINVAKVDENGLAMPGQFETVTICGMVRASGESDAAMVRFASEKKIVEHMLD